MSNRRRPRRPRTYRTSTHSAGRAETGRRASRSPGMDTAEVLAAMGEDLLSAPPQERDEVRRWLSSTMPMSRLDQMDTAARHADTALRGIAAAMGGSSMDMSKVPDWLRGTLSRVLALYVTGQARTCPHLRPGRPAPLFVAAWRPDLVCCLACTHLTSDGLTDEDHRRCDQCGTVGTEMVTERAAVVGQALITWGLCADCHHAEQEGMPGASA